MQRRRARPVSTLADLAASPAPVNVLALSNPCRTARTSTTRRRCPVGGNSSLSACGDRSVAVSGPKAFPNPLKNNDYSAAVSAVRILLSPPPKYLILLIYVSPRLSQKSPRVSAALRVPPGAVVGRDGSPSVPAWQPPPLSLFAIAVVPFGNHLAVRPWAGLAGDGILLAANRRPPSM